ncbi:hypothetical protein Tco_0096292 [Tanacetum coccineum]
MTNLTDMLSKFVNSNTASTSGSGTLPKVDLKVDLKGITNPKVDLKGITTRSGVAYQGPTIPTNFSSPPKVVERETEVTKDTVLDMCTDKAKNTRKRLKPGKHEHRNGRARKKPGENYQKSTYGQASVNLVNKSQGH